MAVPPHVFATLASLLDWLYGMRATCQAVVDSLGPLQPFPALIRSHGRHIDALSALMTSRGQKLPDDPNRGRLVVAVTPIHACGVVLDLTTATVALCDALAAGIDRDPEAAWLLRAVRRSAAEMHGPALQRRLALANATADQAAAPISSN